MWHFFYNCKDIIFFNSSLKYCRHFLWHVTEGFWGALWHFIWGLCRRPHGLMMAFLSFLIHLIYNSLPRHSYHSLQKERHVLIYFLFHVTLMIFKCIFYPFHLHRLHPLHFRVQDLLLLVYQDWVNCGWILVLFTKRLGSDIWYPNRKYH